MNEAKLNCLKNNINTINKNIAQACEIIGKDASEITVIAVAKNTDAELINVAINEGIQYIGENRVQEFLGKLENYTLSQKNIHFIGHLQTNKVKYIIDKVSMIESVDSFSLAQEINRLSLKNKITMDILLEVNVGDEPTKSGFHLCEVEQAVRDIANLSNVRICGLMCVPPKLDCEHYLSVMHDLFCKISEMNISNVSMQYLSTGMSQCYEQAILNGANIIRLGTALFK